MPRNGEQVSCVTDVCAVLCRFSAAPWLTVWSAGNTTWGLTPLGMLLREKILTALEHSTLCDVRSPFPSDQPSLLSMSSFLCFTDHLQLFALFHEKFLKGWDSNWTALFCNAAQSCRRVSSGQMRFTLKSQQTLFILVAGVHIYLGSSISLDIFLVVIKTKMAMALRCNTPLLGRLPAQPFLVWRVDTAIFKEA